MKKKSILFMILCAYSFIGFAQIIKPCDTVPAKVSKDTAVCFGLPVKLTAPVGVTYAWSNQVSTASITVTPTVSTTYFVTITEVNNCSAKDSIIVTVNLLPTITAGSTGNVCLGSSTIITASGALTYVWSNGIGTGSSRTVNPTVTRTYKVTGTDMKNCQNIGMVNVMVNQLPVVTAGVTGPVCAGNTTTLTVGGASTFVWNHGIGYGSMKTVNPSVTTTYIVTGTNTGNCSDTTHVVVIVNPLPKVTAGGQVICAGFAAIITASGSALSYNWSNGLGSELTQTVNPAISTTYSIIGTDANNCSNIASAIVMVNPLPTINASGNTNICIGSQGIINLNGATNYYWSDGVGSSSSRTVNPTVSMTYTVTGTDVNNCQNTMTIPVVVNSLPTVTAGGSWIICAGDYTVISAGGATTYKWSNGIGSSDTVKVNPTVTRTYKVTGTDLNNCSNTATVTVKVNPLPTVTTTGGGAVCYGGSTVIRTSGAISYKWSNGLGFADSIVAAPVVTKTYTVSGTDANNCVNFANVSVVVNPLPTITVNGKDSICNGSSTTISVSGANTYTWSYGLGNGNLVVLNPTVTKSYRITGTDINNCINIGTLTITVSPVPVVTVSGDTSICMGASYYATASGASTYKWSNGYGYGASKTLSPTITRTYRVTGTDNNCSNIATLTVTVNPSPTITVSGVDSICKGNSTTMTATGAISYKWSNGYGSGDTKTLSPSISMTYYVTGADTNICPGIVKVPVNVNAVPAAPVITLNKDTLFSDASLVSLWYTPLGIIPGQTGSYFIPTATNNYYAVATYNGCNSPISNVIHVVISGINEVNVNDHIAVYPNPVKNKIYITFNTAEKEDFYLEILNEPGQSLLAKKMNVMANAIETIDLSAFPAGVYFVKLISNSQAIMKKIVKQE